MSPKAETANTMTAIVTKATDWDSDSNSSGSEDDDDYLDDLLALQNLQISTKSIPAAAPANPKPSKETDSQVIAAKGTVGSGVFLSPHFVEVDIEPKDSKSTDDASRVQKLLEQYAEEEKNEKLAGDGTQWDAEKETETEASEAVDAFRETVARAPEQVLRYNFGSAPLWPSFPAPPAQHASCPHCGANQVFELQLLGSALSYLKPECIVPTSQEVAGMNFMALAVYTCEKDCEKELGPGAAATSVGTFQFRTQEVRIQNDVW